MRGVAEKGFAEWEVRQKLGKRDVAKRFFSPSEQQRKKLAAQAKCVREKLAARYATTFSPSFLTLQIFMSPKRRLW